ncbi:uncharacterized protein LOC135101574 [Scylla paramamosain]|uniref:uncharacterized protein LOC135101574 n=1 Tax=Scylla paramamosain TaxID=85552 RepID=UPI00308368FA
MLHKTNKGAECRCRLVQGVSAAAGSAGSQTLFRHHRGIWASPGPCGAYQNTQAARRREPRKRTTTTTIARRNHVPRQTLQWEGVRVMKHLPFRLLSSLIGIRRQKDGFNQWSPGGYAPNFSANLEQTPLAVSVSSCNAATNSEMVGL